MAGFHLRRLKEQIRMNSKERILTALNNRKPDRVPIFEAYINEPIVVRLAELLMPEKDAVAARHDRSGEERREIVDLYCSIVKALDIDATCTVFSTGLQKIDEKHARDKFGTLWSLSKHGEPLPLDGPIKSLEDAKRFDMVSKLELDDFAGVKYVIDQVGKEKAHFVSVSDPFKISWALRGNMQTLLLDYYDNPELVHALARISTDYAKAAIDMAVQVGADAIFLPGDLAGEDDLIMSPSHYREYIKPYQREIVEYVHRKGVKIVKHSDGNMWPILNDIVEVAFDGYHPVQPQCMDIAEVKKQLGGKICIVGNIDCRYLLPYGTPEEVQENVRETIEKAAPKGGYIISSSNTIHPACKAENYIAMVEAARKYGVYD
jgi:uroporphyrinogen decarboxylase